MRTCEDNIARLHRLVEGELEPDAAEELREHLEACPRCTSQRTEFERLKTVIEESLDAAVVFRDATEEIMVRVAETESSRQPKRVMNGLLRRLLVGGLACMAVFIISAYLFVHFYFQRTFSYQLSEMVIRCSNGIEKVVPGAERSPLRIGDRLKKGTTIRSSAPVRSFLSFDGLRVLLEGEGQFEMQGRRAFSLEKGEILVASAKKKKPLSVVLGDASVRANGGVVRIARSEGAASVGVAEGVVDLALPDGTTHRLTANQTATFTDGGAGFRLAYAEVNNLFARLRVPVIDRIKQRFREVMSRYSPGDMMQRQATKRHRGMDIPEMGNRPEQMLRFASYTPTPRRSLNVAKAYSDTLSDYYESLFLPSNRSISIGKQKVVPLPSGRAASFPRWSHDGSMIAFIETTPGTYYGIVRVARLDDLDNPWDISQEYSSVRPMFPLTWAPDDRHVLFQVQTAPGNRYGVGGEYKLLIAPIDPGEGPLREFDSPFYDIPLPLPLPVGKTISPSISKLPWGDAMCCANWGNLAYIPVEEDGQSMRGAPGLFLTNFNPRELFVMGGGFSPSGGMMDFTAVEDLNFNRMNSYILYDAEDILDGFAPPPRSVDDPRIKRVAPTDNVQFTGGFSFDESLVFVHEDVNHAFDARWPTNIFSCDFDIFYANAMQYAPGKPTQIHLPGNQMFLEPSPEGNRISYSNSEDSTYELRIVSFDVEADIDVDLGGVLIDNSGTNLIVPPGALEENFNVKISTPFSIEDEAEIPVGESHFFAMRLIDAAGLEAPKFIEPMTLTIRYTDDEVAGLDEGMLEIYYYDESDPEHPRWVPLGGTVDPEHNEITVEIRHFSKFSVGGTVNN